MFFAQKLACGKAGSRIVNTLSTLFFFFFNRAIYQRWCDSATILIFTTALNHLNSANARAERQHKSPFLPFSCGRVMSAAADKDSPVVRTDKCPTTMRLSLLARSCILTRRRAEARRSSPNKRHLVSSARIRRSAEATPPDGTGAVI